MPELLRWLNGWVYSLFGADGLVAFSAHPLLYSLAALALLLGLAGTGAWWLSRRVRAVADGLRIAAALAWTPEGRRCLALARRIRRGGARLRRSLRTEIEERTERRMLLRTLERFTRTELQIVLAHALALIRRADDRREARLQGSLERLTLAWSGASDEAERERLAQDVASTRHLLAQVSGANAARDRHLEGLGEAAAAVQALEDELQAVHLARSRSLPDFRDHLTDAARQLSDLEAAYRELEPPR